MPRIAVYTKNIRVAVLGWRAKDSLTGTELLLDDMPSVDTARLIQDDANALELGPRAVDNAFSKDPQALAAKPRVAPFHLIACFNSVK